MSIKYRFFNNFFIVPELVSDLGLLLVCTEDIKERLIQTILLIVQRFVGVHCCQFVSN